MIADGYQDSKTIANRISAMEKWLSNPELLEADETAKYAAVIEVDMDKILEPIVACPNDPDDVKTLSDVAGTKIDEVFIGSCMTNIGHFRAATKVLEDETNVPTKLWVAPPTKMDEEQLIAEGQYATFGKAGARMETPGCSLCMGNQARVANNATVMSTSTRNFPNRLGKGANVYLSSVELAAVAAKLGKIPSKDEYMELTSKINAESEDIYRYLNFNEMSSFVKQASAVKLSDIK